MPTQLKGTSLTPFGAPSSGELIRFTSVLTEYGINRGIRAEICCDKNGAYLANLENGVYFVESRSVNAREWIAQGTVIVHDSLPAQITLVDLIKTSKYHEPDPK